MRLRNVIILALAFLIGCTASQKPVVDNQVMMAPTYVTTAGLRRAELTIASTTGGYTDTGNTEDTDNDFTTTGGAADYEWMARKYTAVNTGKVVTATVVLKKTGTPPVTSTIAASIYSDDGEATSLPDTIIGSASDSVTITSLDAGGASQTFTWSYDGPDQVASTVYWLVLKTTGYTYENGVTEVIWQTDADGATGLNECAKYDSNATPAWSTMGANVGADLTISSSANWEISSDVFGDAIPDTLRVEKVCVVPTVSTILELRLHTKSTRLVADIAYDYAWVAGQTASISPVIDGTTFSYFNRDGSNKLMGSIRVKSGESASAFALAIEFR